MANTMLENSWVDKDLAGHSKLGYIVDFSSENYGKANKKIAKQTQENNDENDKPKTMRSLHHVGDNFRKKW